MASVNDIKEKFKIESDIINIASLRTFLQLDVDKNKLKSFKVPDQKWLAQDRDAMINFFKAAMVKLNENGTVQKYVEMALRDVPTGTREEIIRKLDMIILRENSIFDQFSTQTNQQQCRNAGLYHSEEDTSQKNCYPKRDLRGYPKTNLPTDPPRPWDRYAWCNNCWLCTQQIVKGSKKELKRECEHILPYLTGSYLLGTSATSKLLSYEFAQSHHCCNQKKRQGEFIKFVNRFGLRSKYMFVSDRTQIQNYVSELTGLSVSFKITGVVSVEPDPSPVPTRDSEKFKEVLKNKDTPEEKELPSPAEQRILAKNMALTIDSVCTEICDILNKKDESELIAIFLHASILDWLFHERVIHTYETQGNPLDILKNQLVSKFETSTDSELATEILNNNSGKKIGSTNTF